VIGQGGGGSGPLRRVLVSPMIAPRTVIRRGLPDCELKQRVPGEDYPP
jgi:hypothetical protein